MSARTITASVVLPMIVLIGLALTKAVAANGTLTVTSYPSGAEVWIDGAFTGKHTPSSISLPHGEHKVAVQMSGGGWKQDVRTVVVNDSSDLSVTLLPATIQSGSIYTQWGNSSCLGGSPTLLGGFAFANHFTHASAEPLCIAQGATTGDPTSQLGDLLYGISVQGVPPAGITTNSRLTCALCQSSTGGCFELSGGQSCPSGYTARYRGYLFGGHYTHQGTGRACVASEDFEVVSNVPDNGGYVYPTTAHATAGTGVSSQRYVGCALCCPNDPPPCPPGACASD
jgi:hypothetical protein